MEDNRISKKLAVFSVLLATIITGIGVAFGYFVWNSTTNTDISFTVEGAVVQLDDGSDITGANLMPVASYTSGGKNVVKKDIKIKLKDATSDTVTVDFKLKINSIDSGLNHSSFMYNLVNASGTSVKSGNFSTSKAGDTISLLTLSTSDGSLTTSLSTYTLYIYINGASGDNPSSMQNQSFDMSFIVEGANSSRGYLPASEVIAGLDDGTTGDSDSGVYKVTHSAIASGSSATGSEIPAVIDYRYYGANPNNYICLDKGTSNTCPDRSLYRIIGSIYEENAGKNLIKVIKATPITDGTTSEFSWDYTSSGTYKNNWPTSTMMTLLNSGAWWNGESGSYYNNSTTATTVNFTDKGLTDDAKKMINDSVYYLGGYDSSSVYTTAMYGYERGTTTYSGNALFWTGKVGLMYPSDYGYAAGNTCVETYFLSQYGQQINSTCSGGWIYGYANGYKLTMTSRTDTSGNVFGIKLSGSISERGMLDNVTTNYSNNIFPVFYLKSSVSITSGTGTQDDPYLVS